MRSGRATPSRCWRAGAVSPTPARWWARVWRPTAISTRRRTTGVTWRGCTPLVRYRRRWRGPREDWRYLSAGGAPGGRLPHAAGSRRAGTLYAGLRGTGAYRRRRICDEDEDV